MRRRVVVTGMGVVTPLGNNPKDFYANLIAGRNAVAPITHFDARNYPVQFAAEVRDFDLRKYVDAPERWKDSRENTWFALAAGRDALDSAGLLDASQADRLGYGVYLGNGEGVQDFPRLIRLVGNNARPDTGTLDGVTFVAQALKEYSPAVEFEQELDTPSAHLGSYFQLGGPNFSCLTACAAGSQAIGEATELIRNGDADVMLTGGSHSMIHPLGVTGFSLLSALSTNNSQPQKASSPFDRHRDGFVMGEGAGLVVLEELEHAKRRGAVIHAEITGYGSTADAFRVTDCHPEGRGATACMKAAIANAGLTIDDIGYINAHGTSTPLNDKVETLAIKNVFGDRAYRIPISSTKSMLGHLIAASGAVELVIGVLCLKQGILPPTINYETPDPECDLDYIPNKAREVNVDHVLSNSFGFGGQNVTLVISRYKA